MKGIRLHMNGDADTLFDFRSPVEGKEHYSQKMLVNLATEKGSDPIFEERGTDILAEAIGGVIIDTATAKHLGNFAALDSVIFVTGGAYSDLKSDEEAVKDMVVDCSVTIRDVDTLNQTASFDVEFIHGDTGVAVSSVII